VILYQNWRLALFAVIVIPLSAYPMVRFGNQLRKIATTGQERTADMSTALQETLTGIRIVKGFTREDAEGERFAKFNEAYFHTNMKSTQVSSITSPVLEAVGIIGIAGIIWYGGSQVIQGAMTPGTFFSFFTAVFLMYTPIKRVASANNTIQQALAAADRVFNVLDVATEAAQDTGTRELDGVRSTIELRNVSFRYEGIEAWALRDISVTVKTGEVLALVGSSGAGKTTLVNLIPRFYDPTEGAILIDGVDLREIRLPAIRRQIGIVSQETLLFDDTVGNNIAYGKDDATIPTGGAPQTPLPCPRKPSRMPRRRHTRTSSSCACRTAMTRSSAKTASSSRAGSASGWPSRGPCSAIRRSSSSTRPRPRWTRNPSAWCRWRWPT